MAMLFAFLGFSASAEDSAKAQEILKQAVAQGGLIVHVGCGDGKLTAALRVTERFIVQGLDADPENVAKARAHIQSAGRHGPVTVGVLNDSKLPYIDNLVNVLVVDESAKIPEEELLRVLAPRGVAIFTNRQSEIKNRKLEKPWPDDIDEWTHWLCRPDNNAVSRDRRVGISRHLQWIMPPLWSRHHNLLPSVSSMVSARGRLFYIIDEGPISVKGVPDNWMLVARDAFNGLLLWKRPVRNWGWKTWSEVEFSGLMRFKTPSQIFRRLVAVDDVLYGTLGFGDPVLAMDAATGKTIREYQGTANTSEILFHDGLLVLAKNAAGQTPGKDVQVIEAASGKTLWERKGFQGTSGHGDELKQYTDAYVTVGGDRVFFLDGDHVVALELKTGKDRWRSPRPDMKKDVLGHYKFNHANLCSLVYNDKRVFLGQMFPFSGNLNKVQEKQMVVRALDAGSGKKLWDYAGASFAHFTPPDLFVSQGLVWTFKPKAVALVGLDPASGAVKKEYPAKQILVGHHARCYRNKATERFYLAGEEGIEYIDFKTGEIDVHHWVRGACRYGILPANGLIYLPTHSCGCHANSKLNGFIALSASGYAGKPTDAAKRLVKGPGLGQPADEAKAAAPEDWPAFKHDNMRGNCTSTAIPAAVSPHWTCKIGGDLTAPTVAAGRVFVAAQDAAQLYGLDAKSGDVRWQITTDGSVDSPPTYHKGKLVFGTRGGFVCALRADDGKPIWRFQAAPSDVQLTAFGRLESPWPVNGSPVILNDKVYCVAGRSMNLDSGLYVYALEIETGKVVRQMQYEANTKPKGELEGVSLPDVLVSDGKKIYMRNMQLSPEDLSRSGGAGSTHLGVNDGGLLDYTWFNSAFWMYGNTQAQMLVFDDKNAYGIKAYNKMISKSYGHDIFTTGKEGYSLFAQDVAPSAGGGGKKKGKKKKGGGGTAKWTVKVPIRSEALVLTPQHICLAGTPDVVDTKDPLAALEYRRGGVLALFARADGKKLSEHKLESAPVYDGMAAAQGCLFVSLRNGSVICLGK